MFISTRIFSNLSGKTLSLTREEARILKFFKKYGELYDYLHDEGINGKYYPQVCSSLLIVLSKEQYRKVMNSKLYRRLYKLLINSIVILDYAEDTTDTIYLIFPFVYENERRLECMK